ncbi:CinA family protein [Methylobacterium terricola]|uniref:CinA family protein n=1 Tax=Methylobacterium terricola TaxID=2583531 RepID=A0A5C4L959_9HYPH|nr:CinA family protein [Methylobacterium terricola]TNC08928.1 CinA family protein [Methylobacterium terricola]
MRAMMERAGRIAALLTARRETVAVAESSAGGLVSAALLAVPGASAYYLGGAVVYTAQARQALIGLDAAGMDGLRSASEPYAARVADLVRERHGAVWGLCETGAAGPGGNRYGDSAGHTCLAVAGPVASRRTVETGDSDRAANMEAFAAAMLDAFLEALAEADGAP